MTPASRKPADGSRGDAPNYPEFATAPAAPTFNLRDFGGYRVPGGGALRRGLLYRSAQLCRAEEAESGLLARLGIATVIDFRGSAERNGARGAAFEGFVGRIV